MAAVGGCRDPTWDARIPGRPSQEIAPHDARPSQKHPAFAGKTAAEPAAKPAEQAAPAKPRISPEEQRAREAADQEAKRIRLAALSRDAEALKISLIDRYPHLFAVNPPRPLASGIHRVLAEQTGAPMPVLRLALAKLTRRNAYLAALGAGGPRYGIDGRTSGMISPDDQQAAAEALQRRLVRSPQAMARRKERKPPAAARS